MLNEKTTRPWGGYQVLEEGKGFKVKRLWVKPGEVLSLQLHDRRDEHWVVVLGEARIVKGSEEIPLKTNESAFIPAKTKHRITNPGQEMLELIEVQIGDYLGEDDIVRFEDKYHRV